ncbi:MAG TPA: class I SAM-dependent methyltransferase [Gaiellaceae bacterium]
MTEAERTSSRELIGPRCLRCLGQVVQAGAALTCTACGAAYEPGPRAGTIAVGRPQSRFRQELDADVVSVLEPLLDGLSAPACTERAIAGHAEQAGIEVGNPVWEGRFDVARALPQASGVVLDLGCGFGTSTIALARSAAHVLALDPSPTRVRLTAARLRAEGLRNATVIQADGLELPLANEVCDLVTVVGVLEWLSLGSSDPLRTQRHVLSEVARVLRPGGVLLLGIENRYGAQYFGGFPEEHVELRFVSLLPRRLGDVYARLAGRGRVTTYTHSRRALLGLLEEAGLHARLGLALPSYGQPQLVFDEEAFRPAWDFYLRHVFHYSSPARRSVAALARRSPPAGGAVAPGFFALARKGAAPDPLPTIVTGTADCRGSVKTIDWDRREIAFRPRLDLDAVRSEPLVDGWNGRRWLTAPVRRSERRRRELHVLEAALGLLAERPTRSADPASLAEARDALAQLAPRLRPETVEWHQAELAALEGGEPPAVYEHGDFVTGNLVVGDDEQIVVLDASRAWAAPGRDSVVLVLDVFGLRAGAKATDVDAGLGALTQAAFGGDRAAAAAARLLDAELALREDVRRALRLSLVAVFRHYGARGSLHGVDAFAERAASGELLGLLERLRAQLPAGRP